MNHTYKYTHTHTHVEVCACSCLPSDVCVCVSLCVSMCVWECLFLESVYVMGGGQGKDLAPSSNTHRVVVSNLFQIVKERQECLCVWCVVARNG